MTAQIGGVAGRQNVRCNAIHDAQGLAQREGRREIGRDGGASSLGKVVQLTGHHDFADLDQRGQRHHDIASTPHEQSVDVIGGVALCVVGLHDHIKLLAAAFVTRHRATTQQGLDGSCNGVHVHTSVGGALTVNVHANLGFVQAQIGVDLHKTGVFGQLVLESAHDLGQVLIRVGGDHHKVDGALPKALAQGRRRDRECRHARQTGHPGGDLAGQLLCAALALIPRHGAEKDVALRHGRAADVAENAIELRVRLTDAFNRLCVALRVRQGRAIGAADVDQDHATVFQWGQFLFGGFEQKGTAHR